MPETEPGRHGPQTDEAAFDRLAERIAEAVERVLSQKLPELRAAAQTRLPEPSLTGLALPLGEPAKAAAAKDAIKENALDRQGLIDTKRLARMLSIGRSTLRQFISSETIPRPVRLGRCARWREVEILAWLEEGCPAGGKWETIKKQAVRDYERSRRIR